MQTPLPFFPDLTTIGNIADPILDPAKYALDRGIIEVFEGRPLIAQYLIVMHTDRPKKEFKKLVGSLET